MVKVKMIRRDEVFGEEVIAGTTIKVDRETAERLVKNKVAVYLEQPESAMMEQPEKAVQEKPEPKMPPSGMRGMVFGPKRGE